MLLPPATVTDAGTLKLVVLEVSATLMPPPTGADPVNVTVQVEDTDGAIDVGLQETELRVGVDVGDATVIVPPVAPKVSDAPVAVAAIGFVIAMAAVLRYA